MFDNASDPIGRSVSRLPILSPDERRGGRLRERCRARLARCNAAKPRRFGHALVAGLCLLYLAAVVHDVLWLRGMF